MPRKQITLSELVAAYGERLRNSMYHTFPGVVTAFHDGGYVDVTPATHDVRYDVDTGERVSEPFPTIAKVRVLYPSGGGMSITWPLAAGDRVTLLAYDLDPTVHQQTGGVADPPDVRRHGGTYWACLPCDGSTLGPSATDGAVVVDGPGLGAIGPVAMADKVDAIFHAMTTWVPVPNDGGAALKAKLVAAGLIPTPAYTTASAILQTRGKPSV